MCRWGIKQRVLTLTILPTITISLFMGIYFIGIRVNELHKNIIDKGHRIISRLSILGKNGVKNGDYKKLISLAKTEKVNKELSSIIFYNNKGINIASTGKIDTSHLLDDLYEFDRNKHKVTVLEKKNRTTFIAPIYASDDSETKDIKSSIIGFDSLNPKVIGWVKVDLELDITNSEIYKTLLNVGIIVLIGLSISSFIAFRLGNNVTIPILAMTSAIARIKKGFLDTRINNNAKWELGILTSGINTMAQTLENSHQELQYKIEKATTDLRKTLKTIEVQNIELEKARNNAEDLSKAKSEFLANMSHELRTPLNGIIGFINLLKQTKLNHEQKEFLNIVEKSSNSLLGIINDILDFSKIEARKLQIFYEPMDLHDCVEEAAILLAPSAHEKSLELVTFIYSDVPQKVICDSLRIKQIITNLVSNAVKFTESGSVIIRVMLDSEDEKFSTICVSITDTGIGLSEEQKKNIFTAFNQATPEISRKFGGTGLGLVICKKLISQMQGEIKVESSIGKGATFWFTFKAKKISITATPNTHSLLENKNVILFEPHKTSRLALLHTLNSWGMQVNKYESFEEIINDIKLNSKLAVIGINQQIHCSQQFKQVISNLKKLNIKTIVLVNSTNKKTHEFILNLGADLCLSKPILRANLYNIICENLSIKQEQINFNKDLISDSYSDIDNKIKVLSVDDNYANSKLVGTILEKMGIQVVISGSGEDAIQAADNKKFDLILMDINMPSMDGIAASKIIRKSSTYNKNTPIIALSAYISKSTKDDVFLANMQGYLTKPVYAEDLRSVINKWSQKNIENNNLVVDESIKEESNELMSIKTLDWDLCLKYAAGNKKLAIDLLEMLINSLDNEKKMINRAYSQKNIDELKHLIHKLHGACCYSGVPKLRKILYNIEKSINDTQYNKISFYITKLNQEIQIILDNREEFLNNVQAEKEIL